MSCCVCGAANVVTYIYSTVSIYLHPSLSLSLPATRRDVARSCSPLDRGRSCLARRACVHHRPGPHTTMPPCVRSGAAAARAFLCRAEAATDMYPTAGSARIPASRATAPAAAATAVLCTSPPRSPARQLRPSHLGAGVQYARQCGARGPRLVRVRASRARKKK